MKRLLCILGNMNSGGAETFLMKLYRQIDRSKYQMDFCLNVADPCFYGEEIRKLGGRIFVIPSKSESVSKFKKALTKVIKENNYEYVLRITSTAIGFMDLKVAKKAGARVCSVRSSNSSDGASFKAKIAHRIGRILYGRYADVKFAPSDLAAQYTFGEKAYKNGKVSILHNAVDLDVYRYSQDDRIRTREELGIAEDAKVIGHIGRFMEQKNHTFLIDVFKEIKQKNENSVLLLVGGNGNLEATIRKKISDLGLENDVIFAGIRSDIPRFLSAMDVFVMPSLYEGMPNTVIEAQATGLPCVIADTITREADITGMVNYLPLENASNWCDKVISAFCENNRVDTRDMFVSNRYDIQSVVNDFVNLVFDEG